jgi:hypothetical protein
MITALAQVKSNPESLKLYLQGISLLYQSGVLEALRENGRVSMASPELPNYIEYQAQIAAWSNGFNMALDQLLNFKEMFLDSSSPTMAPLMDFGGLDIAVKKGDLTENEANDIRATKRRAE